MSTPIPEPLAGGFPPADPAVWREAARKIPGGDGDDPAVPTTRVDGELEVAWLYTPGDALAPDPGGAPGQAPFVRGPDREGRETAWDIRQEHARPERQIAHAELMEDLEGGATGITVRFDRAAREGHAPGSEAFARTRGDDGIMVSTLDDLDEVLDGVFLDLAPVALDAGAQALPAAALLVALWERRYLDLATVRGALRCDPIGTLAAEGVAAGSPEVAVISAGQLAAEVDGLAPEVRALSIDTRAYVDAGASAATELAMAVATGAAYLRACAAAGLDVGRAARQIEFTLTVGPDQFLEIAKLRAVRRMWARVLEASGVAPEGRVSAVYARTTRRMLSAVDPWVNLLRGTTATFAAAVGGADGVTVTPFDAIAAPGSTPGPLGRRMARNTQLVLHEESALGGVADPAGGSWYVESLTDALARAAWERLREIEREGGALAVLRSGSLAAELAQASGTRDDELARRARQLTGVNEFPLLGDDGLEPRPPVDREALARIDAARLAERTTSPALERLRLSAPGRRLRTAATLAAAGARIDELAAALAGDERPGAGAARLVSDAPLPLPRHRDAEPFERLRARAEAHAAATGEAPRVYLACLGPLAAHVAVATWARSFFEVGGILAVPSGAHPDRAALVEAFRADGAGVAVVCAGRKEEPEAVAAAVAALRDAGAQAVYLAAADPAAAQAAGADEAVAGGIDMVAALTGALRRLGVDPEDHA